MNDEEKGGLGYDWLERRTGVGLGRVKEKGSCKSRGYEREKWKKQGAVDGARGSRNNEGVQPIRNVSVATVPLPTKWPTTCTRQRTRQEEMSGDAQIGNLDTFTRFGLDLLSTYKNYMKQHYTK